MTLQKIPEGDSFDFVHVTVLTELGVKVDVAILSQIGYFFGLSFVKKQFES